MRDILRASEPHHFRLAGDPPRALARGSRGVQQRVHVRGTYRASRAASPRAILGPPPPQYSVCDLDPPDFGRPTDRVYRTGIGRARNPPREFPRFRRRRADPGAGRALATWLRVAARSRPSAQAELAQFIDEIIQVTAHRSPPGRRRRSHDGAETCAPASAREAATTEKQAVYTCRMKCRWWCGVLVVGALNGGCTALLGINDLSSATDAPSGSSSSDAASPDAGGTDAVCVATCVGDVLIGCGGTGDTTCALGCSPTNGAHCERIVPSNDATLSDLTGVTDGLIADGTHFVYADTDTGTIYTSDAQNNSTQLRGPGTGAVDGIGYRVTAGGLAVFAIDSLSIAPDGYMRPFGNRPVIFLARGAVTIRGVLDMSGGCTTSTGFDRACPGPGGGAGGKPGTNGGPNTPATGCGPGGSGTHTSVGPDAGAGGGAMALDGGEGGSGGSGGVASVAGGLGGKYATCAKETLVPLGGGAGGGMGGNGGAGGGGGGAIQITSYVSITVATDPTAAASAQLDASGRGGQGSATSGGAGGGAGGAILLEAPAISISGNVTANGGGGGSGRVSANTGTKGSSTSATPAAGGAGDAIGGTGGNGGAGVIAPTAGSGLVDGGGGGGGAYGRIRFNVPAGTLTTSNAVVSPAAVRGDLARE
ncbi:MAG: hypothetical protein K8W52_24275 [Deltaproteobacteria bacterium]|nr:hypothetical protein [Deltaproteobacteria bacterium]